MLNLALTTDKLQLITGQAGAVDVHVSYEDRNAAGGNTAAGKQNTAIATATTTDILAAPASGITRRAQAIHVRNAHASTSVDVTVVYDANGTDYTLHKVTLRAGEALEYIEGVGFFLLATNIITPLIKVLAADATGTDVNTAQPWFPTAGAVAVAADTTYWLDGLLVMTRAAGTTSHTTSILFAGTATLTGLQYVATATVGETEALLPRSAVVSRVATATVVKAASVSATEAVSIKVDGIIRVNAAGTLIPQFIYSVAPGGVPTIKTNSHFRLDYLGTGGFTANGTWS